MANVASTDDQPTREGRVRKALGPFRKTGSYYARSWSDYLDHEVDELPLRRPTLSLAAHAFRDELVIMGLLLKRPLGDDATFERINGEVVAAIDFFGEKGYLEKPEEFFTPPPPPARINLKTITRRRTYEHMSFDSGYEPAPGEPGRDRYLGYTANRRAHVLMFRHDSPGRFAPAPGHNQPVPWLVCVHGTDMGRAGLDLALFRAWHLHRDLGLNVILPVLPMHGPRARGLPKGAAFPGEDVLDDVHATAQAVSDVRSVIAWIREQQPGARIGLNGMSLGGYISALVGSLDDDLVCAVLGVPPANLIEIIGRVAGLGKTDPRLKTVALAEPLGLMTSPLSLTPKVPMQGRFVYGGVADRVVHPREQVSALWRHWGRPEIVWYAGGHLAFLRSRPVHEFIDNALVQSGLVS